jgi:hypothetical protein
MQAYHSRVLEPLTVAVAWLLPIAVVAGVGFEVWQSWTSRGRTGVTMRAERRASRFLLAGALLGVTAGYAPLPTWLEGRLGMFLVLPTLGASLGLVISALVGPAESHERRVADLQPRSLPQYLSSTAVRLLWISCTASVVIAGIGLVLPPEPSVPADLLDGMGPPALAPTRALYAVTGVLAVGTTVLAWVAAGAIVRRARPAADGALLALQDQHRRLAVQRLVSWTTATLLFLNATLMTPFPAKMGGVVFSDFQLIQRLTDALILVCVGAAVATLAHAHRRPERSRVLASS